MKKITTSIIMLTIFFSSFSVSFAEEWYIEKILDLNFWVEEKKLDLSEINNIYFKTSKYTYTYEQLKIADSTLRKGFMEKYRNWDFEYYQTNWIVTNYNNFIYYTNKFFFYLKIKEQNNNFVELDTAIINSYTNMRSSYRKVKELIR